MKEVTSLSESSTREFGLKARASTTQDWDLSLVAGTCEVGDNFTTSNCNKKLIGARFFVKAYEASVGAIIGAKRSRSPRDDDGHGTHTASIAAGSVVNHANLFGYASGVARGMASNARVAVYKVCSGDTCAESDIMAGMDAAISDNVNVISASVGVGGVDYYQDHLAIGAFAAMEKGIVVSCSAGNTGPYRYTVENVAPWMMSVGAGTLDRDFPAFVNLGNGQSFPGASLNDENSLPNAPVPFIFAGSASANKGAGNCLMNSLDPEKVKGKIVLCEQGETDEVEKGYVVKSAGGVGMVMANENSSGEELIAEAHLLPTVAVGFKAGNAITEYLTSTQKPTATLVFRGTRVGIEPAPVITAFSSRGPSQLTPEILKPDFIAPGVNILGAWTKFASPTSWDQDNRRVDFNILSGTSMSCPHASGIAALIKSVYPNWSPAAVRSALMTTSYSTYKNGQKLIDNSATTGSTIPFDVGAGHVNPVAALSPGLVYDLTTDDYLNFLCAINYAPDKIEAVARRKYNCDARTQYSVTNLNYPSFGVVFKTVAGGNGATIVKHMRTLTNVAAGGTYKVSTTLDIPSVNVTVEPGVLSFNQNESKSFTVTFTTSGPPPPGNFGFGHLPWSNGKNIVGSPIAIMWDSGHNWKL